MVGLTLKIQIWHTGWCPVATKSMAWWVVHRCRCDDIRTEVSHLNDWLLRETM